jgi:hypothetical protein
VVEIPIGAEVVSDPVRLDVPPLADIAISIYAPNQTGNSTKDTAQRVGYTVSGNQAASTGLKGATLQNSVYWVSGIEVLAPADASVVVVATGTNALGEGTALDPSQTWPSLLAVRLQGGDTTKHVAVVATDDAGRLLEMASRGESLNGFDQIIWNYTGVRRLMLCPEGPFVALRVEASRIAESLITVIGKVIDEARARNISTIGCTMSPSNFGGEYTDAQGNRQPYDAIRVTVNEWIRSSGAFDGVIDFDSVAKDPARPGQLKPEFLLDRPGRWSGSAHQALAESIDLSLFAR